MFWLGRALQKPRLRGYGAESRHTGAKKSFKMQRNAEECEGRVETELVLDAHHPSVEP